MFWGHVFMGIVVTDAYIQYTPVPWKPEQYPNPDLDSRTCRTEYYRFCDPDQVIVLESELRTIEDYLRKERSMECQDNMYEIQLAVAIVKQVSIRKTDSVWVLCDQVSIVTYLL